MIAMLSGLLGWNMGYHEGTGVWPGSKISAIVLPVEVSTNVTSSEANEFIDKNKSSLPIYGEDANCVEYGLLMVRAAQWEGIPAEVVLVQLTGEANHIVISIKTVDKGWEFIDPYTGVHLRLKVGGDLFGETILGLYMLEAQWVPITEVAFSE